MARFLGVELSEGARSRHLAAYYYSAFASLVFFVGVNTLQPYLLTTFLGIPTDQQGSISGALGLVNELVILLTVGAFGIASDRRGRRFVNVLGFIVMAAAFGLFGFAYDETSLTAFRAVYAVGAAAATAMLATIAADYVVERDRGKATGIMGVMNGLGAMTAALVVAKAPGWLTQSGYDPISAGRMTYAILAGFGLLSAAFLRVGLKAELPEAGQRPSFRQLARQGIAAGRDPKIALAYASAFVSRGDLAVVGTYIVLWTNKHAVDVGLSSVEGIARGGAIIAILQGAALLWAPVIGVLTDRLGRVAALCVSLSIAGLGYCSTYMIDDPSGELMMMIAPLIGIGQISVLISSQVFVQQLAPVRIRGSVIGFFGLCGALGIMISVGIGGWLFDAVSESGPFVFVGILNIIVLGFALTLARSKR